MYRKMLALDGVRLGMREWGASNSSHSKRILALHGWLDNANSYTYLGPYLADKGYHVVALDHIGHGHSDHLPKGGTYTLSRSVAFTRDAMDALGWESSHVVGHSMGASISLMYSAVFPEKVEKLVLIEGFGPLIEPAEATTRNLRRAIDGERSMRLKKSQPKLYANLSLATDARENIVKSYPGTQFLSREAARALVSRGSRLQNADGSAPLEEVDSLEDVANDTDGPLRFRHDQRLVLPSMNYHTREQVYSYFHHLQAQTLLLTAENGWPMTPTEEFNTRRAILEEKGILQSIHTEGSHHPHLDPATAPMIAGHIEHFLSTTRVPRKE